MALVCAASALVAPACGNNVGTGGTGGGTGSGTASGGSGCKGGVIVNGVCEGKCTPDKCLANNTCVDNACVLKCTAHTDCAPDGSQSCLPAKEDDTMADILACQSNGKPVGQGAACPFGTECNNRLLCPDGGTCFADQCANSTCMKDDMACGTNATCTIGKCGDGSPCRTDCTASCKPFLACHGAGEADADAYCTKLDCASDDDCVAGFYCGIVRDPHDLCGATCTASKCVGGSNPGLACAKDGDCQKGNTSFCGKTPEACVTVPDMTSRFEGSLCVLRKSCLKRQQGDPCKTDLDCSQFPSQVCAALGTESRCATKCLTNTDCLLDAKCDPTLHACLPKFGAWKMPMTYCAPCQNDEDCGSKGSSWGCSNLSSGMRACIDERLPDMCMVDADCPKTPSGKLSTCLSENQGVNPGDSAYHHCYFPINAANDKTSCF